jgi:hypothetical protein
MLFYEVRESPGFSSRGLSDRSELRFRLPLLGPVPFIGILNFPPLDTKAIVHPLKWRIAAILMKSEEAPA